MEWDNILKNQITSTKQGVLTSDAPLPKKKKRDCNKILREMSEDLKTLFEIEVQQIIKKHLRDLGTHVDNLRSNKISELIKFRKQEEDIEINKGRKVKSAFLKFGNTKLSCVFRVGFVPFDNEDVACSVLNDMKKLRYGTEVDGPFWGNNGIAAGRKLTDLNLNGSIMDFIIQYIDDSPARGSITIFGSLNVENWPQEYQVRKIFRDDYERIVRNVLSLLKSE